MATRAMGPLAGIGWLKNAINLGRGNPKAVFGGAAILLGSALLPTALTLPLQMGLDPGIAGLVAIMAVSLLASLLMVPLMGGYLRLIDAAENGRPARAGDVFCAYRPGGGALRLIGFALAMLVVYLVAVAAIIAVAGTGILSWYLQAITASQQGGADPAALQPLPEGLGLAVALGSVLWLFMSGMYAIGFCQVSLGRRGALAALGDGVVGSLKNLLPLLVMALAALVAMLVLGIVLVLMAMLLGLLAKLGGAWLLAVIAIPLYLAFLLGLYVVLFGVIYHLWRDVCGGGDGGALPAPLAEVTA